MTASAVNVRKRPASIARSAELKSRKERLKKEKREKEPDRREKRRRKRGRESDTRRSSRSSWRRGTPRVAKLMKRARLMFLLLIQSTTKSMKI